LLQNPFGAGQANPIQLAQLAGIPTEVPPPEAAAPQKFWDNMTLMLRNLPNKITQRRLLERFQTYMHRIDFFYLPTDFENKCNLGYAFINFRDGAAAEKFVNEFDGTRLIGFRRSQKVLAVQPARVQGLVANIRRFRNSSVMGVLSDEDKPLLLRDGVSVPFPKPDGPLRPVGRRYQRGVQ
jgi:RNA recognition motif-containing protein